MIAVGAAAAIIAKKSKDTKGGEDTSKPIEGVGTGIS